MMLMRDRSGRSGRRRGSQKPGTAIGLLIALAAGSPGAAAGGGLAGCALAVAIVAMVNMAESTDLMPPRVP